MANERQMQFRVGLLVMLALSLGIAMAIRFGDLQKKFEDRYALTLELSSASGLYPNAPVLLNGLSIGNVREIVLDPQYRGVLVTLDIREEIRLPNDSRAIVTRALLGDVAVEILAGVGPEPFQEGDRLAGEPGADVVAMVQRLEGRAMQTLEAFSSTSHEWEKVAKNVNMLMDTKRGDLDLVIERAAESLHQFTITMQSANVMIAEANQILADPATQEALKATLQGMPQLVNETRDTIAATRSSISLINRNLANLTQVTEPVGKRGELMVAKLDSSLGHLDGLLGELHRFSRVVNSEDGSLQRLASDPALYENMARSSESLAVLLRNLEPVLRDVKEFSDKIARHPEILGVGGAVKPSNGLKDSEVLEGNGGGIRQTGGILRGRN
ncbi:MAG: MCE family protein [Planctomycetaceae bacterium]|nr:MCE family protein [Planctomycetaceae bacterium]